MNGLMVTYANGETRFRSVQKTVCPTNAELGGVCTYNQWCQYIEMQANTISAEVQGKILVETALTIINQNQAL